MERIFGKSEKHKKNGGGSSSSKFGYLRFVSYNALSTRQTDSRKLPIERSVLRNTSEASGIPRLGKRPANLRLVIWD